MDARPAGRMLVGAVALLVLTTGVAAAAHLSARSGEPSDPQVLGARISAPEWFQVQSESATVAASGVPPVPPAPPAPAQTSVPLEPAASGPSPEAAPERVRADGPSGTGVWAVVVGIDDYPGSSHDLRAGVADAGDVVAALDRFGVPQEQRQVLLDGAATLPAIEEALDWLVSNAGPESTAVLFFSGHVRQVKGDPDGDSEEVDEAFLMADGEEFVDGHVRERLDDLEARQTWIAVAGCYGAGFDEVLAAGRVLTAASPEDQLAYENDRMGRTYLVEYMVRRAMLGPEPAASVQEAFARAEEEIRRDYPARVPVMIDMTWAPVTLGEATIPLPAA